MKRAGIFSVGRLMEFLAALGQDVRITAKPTKKRVGEMEVAERWLNYSCWLSTNVFSR